MQYQEGRYDASESEIERRPKQEGPIPEAQVDMAEFAFRAPNSDREP